MTFWGVEVKPGKPYTFNAEDLGGKLILTQATLGTGSAEKKSILQVNVGDKSPIYLCTLLPNNSECCSLNLEFAEDDPVKFSVVGPTSIHISGFVHDFAEHDDDCDSCGEDMDESESESSEYDSEDGFDDGFSDEDDETLFPPSPVPNSGVVIEEIVDDEKATNENGGTKQAKKKKQLADSDKEQKGEQQIVIKGNTGASVLESEDEDGFPVSLRKSENKTDNPEANMTTKTAEEEKKKKKKKKDKAKVDDESLNSLKRKVEAISGNNEPKSDATEDADGDASENKKKNKQHKKKKAKTKEEEVAVVKQDAITDDNQKSKTDNEAKISKAKPSRVKTFPNGLVIEELAMGKPDGKRASRGKKVSVHYMGKLQKNGKQFDSNIGRKPFKFRLGIGAVIKGWDIGVEGMRVGDKRRLTIPPSMGYGSSGSPPVIPPNAWLVFDVELVDVA